MASYTFIWPHPASEVYVTGTFDDWAKSEKLSHTGSVFEKTVTLSKVHDKILYKFVVDGNWTTDHMAPSETDSSGNVNNILLAEHLTPAAPTISSVAPGATTTALAGQVPVRGQSYQTTDLPGQFPVTPLETSENAYSVNPLPATSGAGNPISLAAGEKVPEPTSDINSNVKLDQASYEAGGFGAAEQTYSVNPLPATAGSGNPIALAPGEKVPEPSSFTTSTIGSNVRLDQESYEKSGSTVPQLPPVLNAQEQKEAEGAAIFAVPGAAAISSVGPSSTTAGLAGQQPLQSSVPEVVTESQEAASVPPEASASPTAVADKAQLEDELKAKVPEAPSTAESGVLGKSEAGILGTAAAGLAAAGAAVAAGAYAARDKLAEATGQEDPAISSVAPGSTTAGLAGQQPVAPKDEVPVIVLSSQAYSKASPEASASPQAVQDKAFVEDELKDKVPEAPATAESGVFGTSEKGYVATATVGVAAAGAAAAGAAYAAKDKLTEATSKTGSSGNILPISKQDTDKSITSPNGVPEPVVESQSLAHASPEAAANPEAVKEKSAVEQELLSKVPESSQSGKPAPSSSAALSSTAPTAGGSAAALASSAPGDLVPNDTPRSGDVSPFSNGSQTPAAAVVDPPKTSGAGNGSAPPSTPKKTQVTNSSAVNTPSKSAESSPADSKKKRRSFFSKLKEKLKN